MTGETRTDPKWSRTRNGRFHRLLSLDLEQENLSGAGGVYIAWHGGLKPEWVTVGRSSNLDHDLGLLIDNDEIEYYEKRGGVFVAWSQIRDEFQDGVLLYLIENLELLIPPIRGPGKGATPIPVFPPGMEPRAEKQT